MFWKIFIFEAQNRLRQPAVYLYFLAALLFTIFSFSTGSLPVQEKEHINAPFLIALWCAGITMMMMLISSSIMGTPLYRDIEYNTKDYYLTYPITKGGYFWGRYFGSFLFMLFISTSILLGVFIGSKLGPAMGWTDAKQYGPNQLSYYLYPFFTIALPNLFFTSSLFFGLVAVTRNVKVIYSGGILLFLGYFLSIFFLNHTSNETVINLSDPFALNGIRLQTGNASSTQQNTTSIAVTGTFLLNRILWSGIGLAILIYTYITFSFEKFFSGKRDKAAIDTKPVNKKAAVLKIKTSFTGSYNRSTLFNLTKVELLNIVRDNYFWIIVSSGVVFLGLVFWMGDGNNGVPDFPRTVSLMGIFNDVFPFFIFFIIIFYTGETLHRDRTTRYAFINDSLPPPNWVLNGSKLVALLILGTGLSLIPLVTGLTVQIAKGFYQVNLPFYLIFVFTILLPRLMEMVVFGYFVHVIVNNKFVAHGVAVFFWVAVFFLRSSGLFNYNLFLYSYTPWGGASDMDGIGHMVTPIYWFNLYWLLFAGLLIIISALFYYRGISTSFKERLQLLAERFDNKTRLFTVGVMLAFIAVGAYNYYNVSYLNDFTTKGENDDRAILYEKTLKHFDTLPLPKITRIKMFADLYPDKQQQFVKAFITIVNKTNRPVSRLLLDGDELTDYSLKSNGKPVPFIYPLIYARGELNWLRPKNDTAAFRLYQFKTALAPGDSTILEVNSSVTYKGFQNGFYGARQIRNGVFFTGGLPGLGYDDDDEVNSNYVRRKNHLPEKKADEDPAQNDPTGISTLRTGKASDLLSWDLTVSTSGDQTAVSSGNLVKKWQQNGRNYFHYVQDKPGLYGPLATVSARYAVAHDSIQLDHKVNINIYYHPAHSANITRFIAACKDGLRYFDKAYGKYPFNDIRLAETSVFGPRLASFTTMDTYAEYFGWNAAFDNPNQTDYCYFITAQQLAQQWWRFQVAPNSTIGSMDIPEGLSIYSALVMTEKKYGKDNMKWILQDQLRAYLYIRHRIEEKEHPLVRADQWFEWGGKAAIAMYGLRDLMGEDSVNAALRDFKNAYAFKNKPPYAGSNDLYRYLQKHTPDSLKYYLDDTWQKITLYDNKITDVKAVPTANKNEYKVTLKVNVAKVYIDGKGNDVPATQMNDYLDIGIFAADSKNKDGRSIVSPLYLKKLRLTYGEHIITGIVKGKPVRAGVDPYNKLIDRQPNDNVKEL